DLIGEGFDMALRIGTLRDSTLVARKLGSTNMSVVAAPSLVASHGQPRAPEDIVEWPALCYVGSERADIWRFRRPTGEDGSVQMTVRMRANNGNVLAAAAAQGLGVTFQPDFIVERHLTSGALVKVLDDHDWPALSLYAVYPQTRHLSVKARAFIDFLRDRLAETVRPALS
ncbi:MAG: substrate binding domain-containing protein, partial [Pseudomonadota bacterium]